jgi:hypothetical protein
VLDRDGIEAVLKSTENVADPTLKKLALSRFTPSGAIVSRDPHWTPRRTLNDQVLAFDGEPHPDATEFVSIVEDEVSRLLECRREVLVWDDFSTLAARISQQVIFGRGTYCPDFDRQVARLVSASNWWLRHWSAFWPFFARINEELERPTARNGNGSLVCGAVKCGAQQHSQPSSQVAFWIFVMKDAIELHTVRTLALIANAEPGVRQRLMEEVLATTEVDKLHYLEACIKEQLRLWTPVPILLRVALTDFDLYDMGQAEHTIEQTEHTIEQAEHAIEQAEHTRGEMRGLARPHIHICKGQQILLHTGFYHRDAEVFGAAAERFSPDERKEHDRPNHESVTNSEPPLYVFSRHRQACAGQFLVMVLLKAVLAALLRRGEYVLLDGATHGDTVPAAIDQFGLRFWRRPPPGQTP